jgi:hypothetical protein
MNVEKSRCPAHISRRTFEQIRLRFVDSCCPTNGCGVGGDRRDGRRPIESTWNGSKIVVVEGRETGTFKLRVGALTMSHRTLSLDIFRHDHGANIGQQYWGGVGGVACGGKRERARCSFRPYVVNASAVLFQHPKCARHLPLRSRKAML